MYAVAHIAAGGEVVRPQQMMEQAGQEGVFQILGQADALHQGQAEQPRGYAGRAQFFAHIDQHGLSAGLAEETEKKGYGPGIEVRAEIHGNGADPFVLGAVEKDRVPAEEQNFVSPGLQGGGKFNGPGFHPAPAAGGVAKGKPHQIPFIPVITVDVEKLSFFLQSDARPAPGSRV
jgi:hypothetical protein